MPTITPVGDYRRGSGHLAKEMTMGTDYIPGYSVNMRQDRRTGEYLAVIPTSYDQGRGRYYMAYTLSDGWVELAPAYVTRHTRTVSDYPDNLKRAVDRNLGYILATAGRLAG